MFGDTAVLCPAQKDFSMRTLWNCVTVPSADVVESCTHLVAIVALSVLSFLELKLVGNEEPAINHLSHTAANDVPC